jgi:hypothetical protein
MSSGDLASRAAMPRFSRVRCLATCWRRSCAMLRGCTESLDKVVVSVKECSAVPDSGCRWYDQGFSNSHASKKTQLTFPKTFVRVTIIKVLIYAVSYRKTRYHPNNDTSCLHDSATKTAAAPIPVPMHIDVTKICMTHEIRFRTNDSGDAHLSFPSSQFVKAGRHLTSTCAACTSQKVSMRSLEIN